MLDNLLLCTYRHFPTEQSETGSPTTATRLWARVNAVFSSLGFEKKPKSTSFPTASGKILTHGLCVRTVLRNTARNCLPVERSCEMQHKSFVFGKLI